MCFLVKLIWLILQAKSFDAGSAASPVDEAEIDKLEERASSLRRVGFNLVLLSVLILSLFSDAVVYKAWTLKLSF